MFLNKHPKKKRLPFIEFRLYSGLTTFLNETDEKWTFVKSFETYQQAEDHADKIWFGQLRIRYKITEYIITEKETNRVMVTR